MIIACVCEGSGLAVEESPNGAEETRVSVAGAVGSVEPVRKHSVQAGHGHL